MEAQERFREGASLRGLILPADIIGDGTIQRCDVAGKNGKNDGAYIYHSNGLPAGGYQNHQDGNGWENWCDKSDRKYTAAEKMEFSQRMAKAKRLAGEKRAADERARIQKGLALWKQRQPMPGQIPDVYLGGRAIIVRPVSLGFHPEVYNFTTRQKHPALIAAIQSTGGMITGVQAIFLTPEGHKIRGDGVKAKLIFGVAKGGAVRLSPLTKKFIVTEGVEDGLSILQSIPDSTVWCGLGGNLSNIIIPKTVKHVIIGGDNDDPGMVIAQKLAERLKHEGFAVSIWQPKFGKDFNDMLRGNHA